VMQAGERVQVVLLHLWFHSDCLVDLISYEVRSVHPHFHVQEAAVGTGTRTQNFPLYYPSDFLKGLSAVQLLSTKTSRNG